MQRSRVPPVAVGLGLIVLLLASSSRAVGQELQQFRVTTMRGAIIRAQPSTSSQRLGVVPNGGILKVLDANSEWVKVLFTPPGGTEQVAYVSRTLGFVERVAPPAPAAAPAATPVPVADPPTPPQVVAPPIFSAPPPPAPASQAPPPAPKPVSTVAQPGPFGVGIQGGVGGAMPSVLYDVKGTPISVRGLFDFGTGYTAYGAQALFRLKNVADPSLSTEIVPYFGGGLFVVTLPSSPYLTGALFSGGVFFTFKSIPSLRVSAEVSIPVIGGGGQTVSTLIFGGGVHYFFPKGR